MKKIALLLFLNFFIMDLHANPNFVCGYKDYFQLYSEEYPDAYIVSATSPDLIIYSIGLNSFEIQDSSNCKDGYASVTVASRYNPSHMCILDIKDGPYMVHPKIQASCIGMIFDHLSYEGFGTYSYKIHLR